MRNLITLLISIVIFNAMAFGKGNLTISPPSLNFGAVGIGDTVTVPITLANTGNSILVIQNITSSDPQFSFTANMPIRILEGQNAILNVSFSPASAGIKSGSLLFTHNGTGSSTTYLLSGTGAGPAFSINPPSLNFGTVNVGSSAVLPVSISNSGDAPLVISNISTTDNHYSWTAALPITIAPGTNTSLNIYFTPSGESNYPASVSFTHNAPGSPFILNVNGTGHIQVPVFNINPASLDFGTVNGGSNASLPVTVTNTGDAPLIISSINSSDAQYSWNASLPLTIIPGGNTSFDITFTPTGEGAFPANVSFTHNASGSPAVLTATGTGHLLIPVFNMNPLSLNFNTVNVGTSAVLPVTITNQGDAVLTISNISSSDARYTYSTTLPLNILPGGSASIDVTFTPSGEGTFPANISFTHNASGSPASLAVNGTGHLLLPVFNINPGSLDFGIVNAGSSSTLPVTITNSGDAALNISTIVSSDPQYSYNGSLPLTVAPGNSASVDITFTPGGEGTFPANISFTHNASGSPASLTVTGTGHTLVPAFNISPVSLEFNTVNVGFSSTLPVSIMNPGEASLIISNISSSDAQYTYDAVLPLTILPGGSTSINVTFTPTGEGAFPANISFTHNAPDSPASLIVNGNGHILLPGFNINPASLDFSAVNVGSSSTLPVTINNPGDAELVISSISSSDPQYTFTASLPVTVAPGSNTAINITFTPQGEGTFPANISFTHNASGSPASLAVNGTGHLLLPVFDINPTSLSFGTVNTGSSSTLPVTITNSGDAALVISTIVTSDPQYTFNSSLPLTITPGNSASVDITFTPAGEGTFPANISFTYNASGSPASLTVTGNGHILLPGFNINPASLDFSTVNVGSSSTLPVIISNPGDAPLTISDITSSDAQFTFNAALPLTILPGANTSLDITFAPASEGTFPASISFTHNASGSPASLAVTGTGHLLTAVFNINPLSLDFGIVNVGSSSTLPVLINNTGDAPLLISNIVSSAPHYTFNTALPIVIAPGGNSSIDITFTPTGEGPTPSDISFTHNGAGSPAVITAAGNGHILTPSIVLSSVSLDFGTVNTGSSAILPLTVSNPGDAALVISNIISSDPQYAFSVSLPVNVGPGDSASINIIFTPTGEGTYPADITFTHNAAGSPAVLTVTGNGHILAASFSISTDSLNFGTVNVGSFVTLPVTISNPGDAALNITDIISSDSRYTFSASLPLTLAPGTSQSIDITFTPGGEGTFPANISFIHNASGSPASLAVNGTGHLLLPVFNINPGSLDFGTVNAGSSSTLPVTITNSGDAALVISTIVTSDPQYTFNSTLPLTITAGNSATVDITFTPAGEGIFPANISFTHNAPGSPASLTVNGNGHILLPGFNINPASLDFSTVNVGSSSTLPVTISNPGDAELIISSISSSDPQYTFNASLPVTVAPGSNTAINITFTPQGEGTFPGSISFTHNASGSPANLSVTGAGHTLIPVIHFSQASINFGTVNVGSSSSIALNVANTGDAPLIISEISSTDNQYSCSAVLPLTIVPGDSIPFNIIFTPTGQGTYPAVLSFTHNASGSPSDVSVTGNGHILSAVWNMEPSSLNFGTVNQGSSASLTAKIRNTGDASLIVSAVSLSDTQYSLSSVPPFNIAPGDSLSIEVIFTPAGEGSFPGVVSFTHNGSGSPAALEVNGYGHILTPVFNYTPDSLNFGSITVGSTAILPLRISNPGDAPLIISGIALTDSQFTASSPAMPFSILPGDSSTLNIFFRPLLGGAVSAGITFNHNASGGQTICCLTGVGATTFQLSVNVKNGWNMVSIPGMHPLNQDILTWWSGKDPLANIFIYMNKYVSVQTLSPGQGYWLKNLGANTYNTGDEWPAEGINVVPNSPIPCSAGWNIIGVFNKQVPIGGVASNPPGALQGIIFDYDSAYQSADTLYPGKGYWVKLSQAGEIILHPDSIGNFAKLIEPDMNWGRITVTDASGKHFLLYTASGGTDLNPFELPPAPPAGMFDVRFGSQRFVENLDNGPQSIQFSGVNYPVKLRVENTQLGLKDLTGQHINAILNPGEEITITEVTINILVVSNAAAPVRYLLEQNYPNPFNPSTVIEFTLPEDVNNAALVIYNALGEKVAELVNGSLQTGSYRYQWNAGNNASGVYICRLETEKFSSVRKMLLIK